MTLILFRFPFSNERGLRWHTLVHVPINCVDEAI